MLFHCKIHETINLLVLHSLADLVQHTPCGCVRPHAHFPLQLQSGNTLTGNIYKVNSIKPHTQVEVRVLKDSPFQSGKLALAVVAIEKTPVVFLPIHPVYASAFRTYITVLVFRRDDEVDCAVFIGKSLCKFKISHYLCLAFDYNANVQIKFESSKPKMDNSVLLFV